jgi:5-methylcytosine-specific restriction endonuclease McrA
MRSYRVSHHATQQIRRGLFVFSKRANRDTAMMLAYLGEFDERKLYRPEAYSSMHQFCVGALGMSEDSAERRIRVARILRDFPALFPAIADGRLHLSGVLLLAPVLTTANAENLVHAASRKSCAQIREMLAMWFPKPEPVEQVMLPADANANNAPGMPAEPASKRVEELSGTPDSLAIPADTQQRPASFARFTPVAPGRYAIEGRVDQALVEKLKRSQELLSHGGKACQLAELLELAADLLLAHAEHKRFGATDKPRKCTSDSENGYITNKVRREVYARDGGQCTFTSEGGRRCEARGNIEYDHVHPVARGGGSGADNVRLLCRAHNQLRAEQTFGVGFMAEKRDAAHQRAIEREQRAAVKAAQQRANDAAEELVPGLMGLGYSQTEARARARNANLDPEQPIEQRMMALIKTLGPRSATRTPAPAAEPAVPVAGG